MNEENEMMMYLLVLVKVLILLLGILPALTDLVVPTSLRTLSLTIPGGRRLDISLVSVANFATILLGV